MTAIQNHQRLRSQMEKTISTNWLARYHVRFWGSTTDCWGCWLDQQVAKVPTETAQLSGSNSRRDLPMPTLLLLTTEHRNTHILTVFFFSRSSKPWWATATYFRGFTLCRTPLDEWLARRLDLYLTTHDTHNRQTDIHARGGTRTLNPSTPSGCRPTP